MKNQKFKFSNSVLLFKLKIELLVKQQKIFKFPFMKFCILYFDLFYKYFYNFLFNSNIEK